MSNIYDISAMLRDADRRKHGILFSSPVAGALLTDEPPVRIIPVVEVYAANIGTGLAINIGVDCILCELTPAEAVALANSLLEAAGYAH